MLLRGCNLSPIDTGLVITENDNREVDILTVTCDN